MGPDGGMYDIHILIILACSRDWLPSLVHPFTKLVGRKNLKYPTHGRSVGKKWWVDKAFTNVTYTDHPKRAVKPLPIDRRSAKELLATI
jgi:hypothetical protein